jgi:hypothetical protein
MEVKPLDTDPWIGNFAYSTIALTIAVFEQHRATVNPLN